MKSIKILALLILSLLTVNCNAEAKEKKEDAKSKVIYLNAEQFKTLVFDYKNEKDWKYLGDKPAILDFYADWCGPCKMLAPHLETIQKEYGDKLQVYKINTDKERELASAFGIQSLPTIVMVPLKGQPQAAMGYRDLEGLKEMVKTTFDIPSPVK